MVNIKSELSDIMDERSGANISGNGLERPTGSDYVVRRLTPTECARLQGFPDDWAQDIAIEDPTDEDIAQWREIFNTYDMATKGTPKKRSDAVIAKFLKNPNSDSAEYKLWGNGIALPCILPMMKAMYDCLIKE